MHHRGLDVEAKPEYYLPHPQNPYRGMILAVRSKQDPRSLAESIRREIRRFDPELPAANVRTLENVASDSIAPRRLSVVLIGVFATVALVLASVGIYGVMSFHVVQRTHEIGVRMALGAQRADVLRLVVGHGMRLVLIGSVLGLVMALLSTRALSAMLYRVGVFDLTTFDDRPRPGCVAGELHPRAACHARGSNDCPGSRMKPDHNLSFDHASSRFLLSSACSIPARRSN